MINTDKLETWGQIRETNLDPVDMLHYVFLRHVICERKLHNTQELNRV